VRSKEALEVMARRCADELPGLAAEERDDRRGVLFPRRLAGRDDRAGVDIVRLPPRLGVGALNELRERVGVDAPLRRVRGQDDIRPMRDLPLDDDVRA
jgi:hypothetical protein